MKKITLGMTTDIHDSFYSEFGRYPTIEEASCHAKRLHEEFEANEYAWKQWDKESHRYNMNNAYGHNP